MCRNLIFSASIALILSCLGDASATSVELVGGDTLNGNFNNLITPSGDNAQPFTNTVAWVNIGAGDQATEATKNGLSGGGDGTRDATLKGGNEKDYGLDTGHTITAGEMFDISYVWRDAWLWTDAADQVRVRLFVTDDDTLTGTQTVLAEDLSGLSISNNTYEMVDRDAVYIADTSDVGKRLFVVIDTTAAAEAYCRFDNFVLSVTSNLLPYDGYEVQVPGAGTVDVTLHWKAAPDPNGIYAVYTELNKHYLYGNFNDPASSTLEYIDEISVVSLADPNASYGPIILQNDETYLWQIEEAMDDGVGGTYPPGSPQNTLGPIWTFDTLSTNPVIVTQPQSIILDSGLPAVFNMDVSSGSPVTYQWFYSVDNQIDDPGDTEIGTNANTYSIPAIQASDEGYYYCKLINAAGLPVYSDVVTLGVRRQVAHWTLDTAKYVGGQYQDEAGDHPADPNGTPVFVSGVNPSISNEGINIDAINSYARAGTLNPSEFTAQMTVLLWLNWNADDDQWHVLLSKRDGLEIDDSLWRLAITPDELVSFSGDGQMSIESEIAIIPGQWIFVAATLDGDTASLYVKQPSSVMMEQVSGTVTLGPKYDAVFNIGTDPAGQAIFNGVLDNIEVYNYVLTNQQIANRFHAVTGHGICDNMQHSVFDVSGPDGNADCIVNFYDFVHLAAAWMESGIVPAQ